MAIKSNVDFGLVNLSTIGDNTVINSTSRGDRYAVSASSLYNTTGASINIEFYESTDLTSGNGILIEVYDIAGGERLDVASIIGQGYTDNIIAVPNGAGCNIKCTGIDYTGSDV